MRNATEQRQAEALEQRSWNYLRNHVLMCPTCYAVKQSPATVSEHGCTTGWKLAEQYREASYDAGVPERFAMAHRPSRFTTPGPRRAEV